MYHTSIRPPYQFHHPLLYCYIAFIILGAIALATLEHGAGILFFSTYRNPIVDNLFRYWTLLGEEMAYLVAIILLCFVKFRLAIFIPVIGVVVTLVAHTLKSFFAQPRPRLYYEMHGLLEQINFIDGVVLHAGATSFPSGHTMSAFALYSFVALCLLRRRWLSIFLFIIAFGVGLSRVVLVQHFLRDIYVGGIIGGGIAILLFYAQTLLSYAPHLWWNKQFSCHAKT
ncbi:MAG: phosphatase PAP2 family protein [Bacteroidota bacterium]